MKLKDAAVVVCGASGFIGGQLVKSLVASGAGRVRAGANAYRRQKLFVARTGAWLEERETAPAIFCPKELEMKIFSADKIEMTPVRK